MQLDGLLDDGSIFIEDDYVEIEDGSDNAVINRLQQRVEVEPPEGFDKDQSVGAKTR